MGARQRHLDGLRGVAILLVLVGHTLAGMTGGPALSVLKPLANGDLGVELFLVLSGYLITMLLLRERSGSGRVGLRRFYARRALRIWPAFYVMIAATVLIASFYHTVRITGGEVASAGLFVWNYSPASNGWWFGHTWSLSVEEQFYLLWPLVLVLCRPRRALVIALVVIVSEPFIRVASYVGHIGDAARLGLYFHTRADMLMMGAVLALLPVVYPAVHDRVLAIVARYRLGPVAVAILVVSSYLHSTGQGVYDAPIGMSVDGLCGAVIILATQQPGAMRRALSFRPLIWLGVISFSLYLWQQLFTGGVYGTVVEAPLLAIAAATASYWLVERPFLRLKRRYAFTSTPAEPSAGVAPAQGPLPAATVDMGTAGLEPATSRV